ncbi:MAG: CYTH domain-containing protein, partial [Ideonella sp.]|nr:CYTH domain-containing protein [Ideonella sp.]
MIETELKFRVPASQLGRLRRALATSTARTQRLQACYYDTPDRALATAQMALRVRREGTHWVQTVKAAGPGLVGRLEHEVPLPGRQAPAGVRLDLHDVAEPVAAALRQALGDSAAALQPSYHVDVRRTARRVRAHGAVVEIALDEGAIRAGEREWPVCEVEFELVSGPLGGLIEVAGAWARRHRLWLDPRSKAERGERLVLGVEV